MQICRGFMNIFLLRGFCRQGTGLAVLPCLHSTKEVTPRKINIHLNMATGSLQVTSLS